MAKDWIGNKAATFVTLAASNHSDYEREQRDFYATEPKALEKLFDECNIKLNHNVLEPSAGNGNLSKVLKSYGYNVVSKDIVERDYPLDEVCDFLQTKTEWGGIL